MAEETLYDEQVVTDDSGDPKDPLGLRKKLSATKVKADPLGLRAKLNPAPITAQSPEYKINISAPTHLQTPAQGVRDFSMEAQPEQAQIFNIGGKPTEVKAAPLQKLQGEATVAADKLKNELLTNDDMYEKKVRQNRADAYTMDQLEQDYQSKGQTIAIGQEKKLLDVEKKRRYDLPVAKGDIEDYKTGNILNPITSRQFLAEKGGKDKSVQAALYLHDANQSAQQTTDRPERATTIKKNAEKIEKGIYEYDPERGLIFKPEDGWDSFMTAWKHKNQLFDDAEKLAKMSIEEKADYYEKRRNSFNPDEAIHLPAGKLGDVTAMIGGQPVKSLIASGIVGLIPGAEEMAPFAGAAVGAADYYRMGRAAGFDQAYNEARDKGIEPIEAAKIANIQSFKEGGVDAAIGAAMPFVGGFGGFKPRVPVGLKTAIVNAFKDVGLKGLEGSAVMGGGQLAKNILAKTGGIDREWDKNVTDQAEAGFIFGAGARLIAKGSSALNKANRNLIKAEFSKLPEEQINAQFDQLVQEGQITSKEAETAKGEIGEFKKTDSAIPQNIDVQARAQIAKKIARRNELEKQMETVDKAFHPEIKEKIKNLEEDITKLSENKTPKPDKAILDLKDLIDSEIEEGNVKGGALAYLKEAAVEDLPELMKDIAEQAHDPFSANQAVETFGETLVNKAKEMYPKEEATIPLDVPPETQKGISVMRPEERTQPTETITIKPDENALPIGKSETPIMGETPGHSGEMGAGASTPEESTGTQAGANKEGKTQDQEKVSKIFVEHPPTELSHRGLQEVANEFSLDDVKSRDRKTDIQLRKDAEIQINDWNKEGKYSQNVERLTVKAEEGEVLTDKERVIMEQHLATVRDRLRGLDKQSPEYKKGLQYLQRLKEAGERTRSEAGAALRLPTFRSNPLKNAEDAYLAKMEAAGVDELTPKQMEEVDAQVSKFQTAEIKAEVKTAELEGTVNEAKAETEFKKVKKQAAHKKKTADEYKADRAASFEAAREALKKLRTGESGLSAVPLPGIRELAAIAPHVKDVLVSLADQGVTELSVAVKQLHEGFKDILEGITEKDIHNIIAGEYNEPRKPLSVLQQTLRDLRDEAKLINDLERLEAGMPPKAEKAKIQRNQKIKALRDKINEFKKAKKAEESGGEAFHGEELDETAKKLNAIKKRNEKAQQDIKRKIENKEFDGPEKRTSLLEDPEVKKNYPQLRKEALDAIVEKENAQHEFELALLKDEMSKRNKGEKLRDFGKKLIATSKAILSGIDDSATFVQNHFTILSNPKAGSKAWLDHVKDAISEPRMQRELAALHNSPSWDLIKNSGLDVLEPKSMAEGKVEEAFENNLLAKKIKIGDKEYDPWRYTGGIFERAFTSLGNNLRVNLFLKRAQQLMDQGKTFETHPEEFKSVARAINELTARGKQNKYIEQANPVLTPIIWAPRMLSSTFNQLGLADLLSAVGGKKLGTEGFYRKLTPDQRIYALKQLGKNIGVGVAAMAAASFAGAEVDYDPRSVTFGNIKAGTKSYNVFGRYATVVKTIVQATLGTRIKPGGDQQDLDSGKFGAKTRGGVIGGFFRGKMTPAAGAAFDLMEGKNFYTNQPFGVKDLPEALLMPMSIKELKTGWEQDGSISLLTRFLPSFEGLKVSDERDFQKETSTKSNKKKSSNIPRHSGHKTTQKH
jgi:hypothetical protein